MTPNENYRLLADSYLFTGIARKTAQYLSAHPGTRLLRMGIGDVSLPLCGAVVEALHSAVDEQARAESFHGYQPECGAPFLRSAIAGYYAARGISLSADEVFVSSGASDELGDLLDLFGSGKTVLIPEPAYPAYVDANIMAGNRIVHLPTAAETGFLPSAAQAPRADIVYLCSPNNPTGAVLTRALLKEWIDYANDCGAIILFDAAYEAFVTDPALPRSIFELAGARTCAIEICSLSKTAGFTGTRCGYTILPKELTRADMKLNEMWVRNRSTKTNGISYILQRGAAAVFTPEGQQQIRENLRVYQRNAACLAGALDALGISYCGGKNAPYLWMKCPDAMGSWEFFDLLLHDTQIVGTPGKGFGDCGEGYFRFSSFGSPADTEEAAARLRKRLSGC